MKTRTFTMSIAAAALMLLPSVPAVAGPLEPAKVPAEAKWVVHVDLEGITQTQLAEQVRQNRPEIVQQIRQWFQNRYGINPQQDLKSLTMFSETYEAHTGTMILQANYELEKVKAELTNNPSVKAADWQDLTLYTLSKPTMRRGQNAAAGNQGRGTEGPNQTLTIILLDQNTAVFASSSERAKAAVQLLKGEATSLEKDSPLIAQVPEGAIVYGAAVDLSSIEQRDGFFPVLRQHERIVWAVGEENGQTFDNLTLVATSEEVAKQVKTTLEGMVAFGKLWAADSENLAKLVNGAEITVNGNTVERKWRGDNQVVLGALDELKERIQQRLQGGRQ